MRPTTRPRFVHLDAQGGGTLCGAAPVTPRRCLHCERSPSASGAWILCGVLLHREHPSGKCRTPALSVRVPCPACTALERAHAVTVEHARAQVAREPLLPFARPRR